MVAALRLESLERTALTAGRDVDELAGSQDAQGSLHLREQRRRRVVGSAEHRRRLIRRGGVDHP